MNTAANIRISDYDYLLPPEKIAQFPLPERDSSKLLVLRDGKISETIFSNVDQFIPENSFLVFNDSKVIRARLIFTKSTGATVEIFCLEPVLPTAEIHGAFQQKENCTWSCLVGNVKRWKNGILIKEFTLDGKEYQLFAEKMEEAGDGHFLICFHWEPSSLTFSEILEVTGRVPLPPYITRGDSTVDESRYQTIYAKHEGSVAAPTAGLHFTDALMDSLKNKNIAFEKLALHVGVGTFRPVSTPTLAEHIMHNEKIVVPVKLIRDLLKHPERPVVAVGTTSVRTLETLYWAGVKIMRDKTGEIPEINQWDPYEDKYSSSFTTNEALTALISNLERKKLTEFSTATQLMIVPGYSFHLVTAMITNFHLPQSTLLLLIAAFIGDGWKHVYNYALANDFRFLSYGDACLFFPSR
jgi:S-adenosylmethionine:tRNA ribosyltransferase-isomerase